MAQEYFLVLHSLCKTKVLMPRPELKVALGEGCLKGGDYIVYATSLGMIHTVKSCKQEPTVLKSRPSRLL